MNVKILFTLFCIALSNTIIAQTDPCCDENTVSSLTQLTFENVPTDDLTQGQVYTLSTIDRGCLSPLQATFSFVSTGGDIPRVNRGGTSQEVLTVQYTATDGTILSGTSEVTYTFNNAVDVRIQFGSNDAVESLTFVTPYDFYTTPTGCGAFGDGHVFTTNGLGQTVWHNTNDQTCAQNSCPNEDCHGIFEWNDVTSITLGLSGTRLAQNQQIWISDYIAGTDVCENSPRECLDGIDSDGDGLTDCDDPQCQAIMKCDPCCDEIIVTDRTQLTFGSVPTGNINQGQNYVLSTTDRGCVDPLVTNFSFISTGGDIPRLSSGGTSNEVLGVNYTALDGTVLSGTSQVTYTFSGAVDVEIQFQSNDAVESVTFVTPFSGYDPPVGCGILGDGHVFTTNGSGQTVWHNTNNATCNNGGCATPDCNGTFQWEGVTTLVLGLSGTRLAQSQQIWISNYVRGWQKNTMCLPISVTKN